MALVLAIRATLHLTVVKEHVPTNVTILMEIVSEVFVNVQKNGLVSLVKSTSENAKTSAQVVELASVQMVSSFVDARMIGSRAKSGRI